MFTKIRSRKAIAALLSCAMLMSLAACSSDKEKSGYELPKGASTEYEVYEKAVAYTNGDTDAIDDIYDPMLNVAFYEKLENAEEDENYTLGLDIYESCDLVSRMSAKISDMGIGFDYDNDDIDFEALIEELPEDRQAPARADLDEFEDFVELIIYITLFDDTEAPDSYETSDESIEAVDEDDYYSEAFDDDTDSADFMKFFGDTRTADIGRVTDDFGYVDIDCYILEIDGAYYLIGFSYVYGSVGG